MNATTLTTFHLALNPYMENEQLRYVVAVAISATDTEHQAQHHFTVDQARMFLNDYYPDDSVMRSLMEYLEAGAAVEVKSDATHLIPFSTQQLVSYGFHEQFLQLTAESYVLSMILGKGRNEYVLCASSNPPSPEEPVQFTLTDWDRQRSTICSLTHVSPARLERIRESLQSGEHGREYLGPDDQLGGVVMPYLRNSVANIFSLLLRDVSIQE